MATLEAVTDPNLIYNIRAKLDLTGYYDEAGSGPGDESGGTDTGKAAVELVAAIAPIVDRPRVRRLSRFPCSGLTEMHR